ncbi:ChaN family lipoprotein [Bacteroidota bacterium]
MRITTLILFFVLVVNIAFASDKPAYKIFDKSGDEVLYEDMFDRLQESNIVMFGELHNNPICHWLQYEVTKDLFEIKKVSLILGAEMFEADNQIIVNEYLKGQLTDKSFEKEAKLWGNYKTDYKPLLEFAKTNNLNFIATNIPRRYASLVYSKGLEALDSLAKDAYQWITPLPIAVDLELKCYKDILEKAEGHGGENLPYAQAIKDATMAYFILNNYKRGDLFLHFDGAYHSDNFEGIVWYLKKDKPNLDVVTISSVEQNDLGELNKDFYGLADFIICINENMTKTH